MSDTSSRPPSTTTYQEASHIFFYKEQKDGQLYLCASNEEGIAKIQSHLQKHTPSTHDYEAIPPSDFSTKIAKISPDFMANIITLLAPVNIKIQTPERTTAKDYVMFKDDKGELCLGATHARARTQLQRMLATHEPSSTAYQRIDKTTAYELDNLKNQGTLPRDVDVASVIRITPECLRSIMASDTMVQIESWESIPPSPQSPRPVSHTYTGRH